VQSVSAGFLPAAWIVVPDALDLSTQLVSFLDVARIRKAARDNRGDCFTDLRIPIACFASREGIALKPAPRDASVVLAWRKVSPSAHLMVDPRNGARAVIRDTGADAGRFLWSVLAAGEMDPISEGRTDDLARAQFLAEAALRASADN
jgi:hypothetical protein